MTPKKQFLHDIGKLQSLNDKYATECARMHQVGFTEAPVIDAADRITCFAVDLLADKYDIDRDAMDWFVWENNFGKSKLTCSWPGEKERKIKTASAFWKFEKEMKK